jgi:hypothetical protein
MGALEELAAALAGAESQNLIASENPYYRLRKVPDEIGDIALSTFAKNPGRFKTKDALAVGVGTGLLSGLLGGIGDDYQSTLTDRYQHVLGDSMLGKTPSLEGLSSNLARSAKDQGSIFAIKRALSAADEEAELGRQIKLDQAKNRADIEKDLIKTATTSPRLQDRKEALGLLRSLYESGATPVASPAEESDAIQAPQEEGVESIFAASTAASSATPTQTAKPSSASRLEQLVQEYGDYDLANDVLRDELVENRKTKSASEKDLLALQTETQNSKQILNDLRMALDGAGDTGGLGPQDWLREQLLTIRDQAGDTEASAELGARKELDNLGVSFAGQIRKLFPGPVSEKEFEKYLTVSPNTKNTKAANEALYRKMLRAQQIADAKTSYIQSAVGQGKSIAEANAEFDREFPLKKLLSEKSGETPPGGGSGGGGRGTLPNGEEESLLGAYGRGILKAPGSLMDLLHKGAEGAIEGIQLGGPGGMAVGAGRKILGFDQGLEEGLRGTGRMAAMTAGAVKGGALGSFTGPLGALAGAGIGAGAGFLGFNSAEEALSEVAGVGTEKTVVPSREDLLEAADVAGQTTALGAFGKVGTKAAKAGTGAAKAITEVPGQIAESFKKTLTGVKPKDIEKAIAENKVKYFDESGLEVPVASAKDFSTAVEQSLKVLEKDNFFNEVSNSPKGAQLLFDQKMSIAGNTVKELHQTANEALRANWEKLSPMQKKQFPLQRDPKTGAGGFQPDFSNVSELINRFKRTDPEVVPALTRRAQAVIGSWNKSSRSFDALQSFKEDFGSASKWKQASTETAEGWNTVKKEIYKSFSDAQMKAFDYAMSQSNPKLVGALKEANAKFHAYKNIEPLIARRAGQSRIPDIGLKETPKGLFTKVAPASVFRGLSKLDNSLSIFKKGASASKEIAAALESGPSRAQIPAAQRKDVLEEAFSRLNQKKNEGTSAGIPLPTVKSNERQMEKEVPNRSPFTLDEIVEGMIAQESSGNPNALSEKGAQGLMQIMPATGRELAQKEGVAYDPYDPEQNRKLGTRYIKELLSKYNGDIELALTAYHTGMGTVDRLLEQNEASSLREILPRLGPVGQKYAREIIERIEKKRRPVKA